VERDADDTGDSQFATKFAASYPESRAKAVVASNDVPADLPVDMAFRGEAESLFVAVNQRDSETFFHRPDLLADGALGDAACLGGAREAAGFTKIAEDLESLDVHGQSFGDQVTNPKAKTAVSLLL